MIFPDSFEHKTGFDTIKTLLKNLCLSELGEIKVDNIRFSTSINQIENQLSLTAEFVDILQSPENFPSQDYYNLIPELERIKLDGTYIELEKLAELRLSYTIIQDIVTFIYEEKELYPLLFALSNEIEVYPAIITGVNRILDDKGGIRDTASDELKKIRSSIKSTLTQIEKRLNQILSGLKKDNVIVSDSEITIRNGRSVIPINASNKRKIKGYIHDESSSGQTVFIEPSEIFEMNNSLRELEAAERKEIIKILTQFSIFLRPLLSGMVQSYYFLSTIDFIRAKALLAIETHSVKPLLLNREEINWQNASHPILAQHMRTLKKEVVPFDILLNQDQRIVVISGPNAGGKSVCLKTVGLLQYMLQCGLLIPVHENSSSGIFSKIFIEIGEDRKSTRLNSSH